MRMENITTTTNLSPDASVFALRVSLEYTMLGSDKFYRAVALPGEGKVLVVYGRRGQVGAVCEYSCGDTAAVARKMWHLLRAKTGKGYVVAAADAAPLEATVSRYREGGAGAVMDDWSTAAPMGWTSARVLAVKSSRPAREGARIIAEMFKKNPDVDTLLEVPFAGECEEFLKRMAYSHPGCPDDVLVVKELVGD